MNLVASSLIFAFRPEWVPFSYTIQSAFFLPLRVWTYTRLKWHYFLFDFCYVANLAALSYLWIWPQSEFLFTIVYCAAHGPLAWSVVTWRNSLVFHSLEKVTSTFIHLYPPFVFMTIRHFTPPEIAEARYPAMRNLPNINGWKAFLFNLVFYTVWQWAYYIFIGVRKGKKIASGERINSYSTLSQGKGAIANLLAKAPKALREPAFMLLQVRCRPPRCLMRKSGPDLTPHCLRSVRRCPADDLHYDLHAPVSHLLPQWSSLCHLLVSSRWPMAGRMFPPCAYMLMRLSFVFTLSRPAHYRIFILTMSVWNGVSVAWRRSACMPSEARNHLTFVLSVPLPPPAKGFILCRGLGPPLREGAPSIATRTRRGQGRQVGLGCSGWGHLAQHRSFDAKRRERRRRRACEWSR